MESLHFTDADWARVERDTLAWWAGELERPLVYLSVTPRVDAPAPYDYQSNYPLDMPAEEVVDLYAPRLEAQRFYADAYPWMWVNFGPGIQAGFLGGQVNSVTEPSETVWFNPPPGSPGVDDLEMNLDPRNPWWLRVQDITRALRERYGGMLQVSHTDLGGNLDILAALVTTEQLLLDVVEKPEAVQRQVERITTLWLKYYARLEEVIRGERADGAPPCRGTSCWTPIWSPGRTYMLQCDFSYMISPKMFERYVAPDLTRVCGALDHAFYHLDGKGEIPHLKHLLAIERLHGIQWIPGEGQPAPEEWLDLLQRIRAGGKLCQVFVSPEGALKIARALGGKGFLFVVSDDRGRFQNPAEVDGFLRALREAELE